MRRFVWPLLALSVPLILAAVVWQSGRVAALTEEAHRLEAVQAVWADANRRLLGSIDVLESRTRAAELAGQLGLKKAGPARRIFIETPSAGNPPAAEAAPEASQGGQGG